MIAPRRMVILLLLLSSVACTMAQQLPPCQGSSCVQPLPGFSCPPAKLWDQDGGRAVCVDCRGVQPPPEQQSHGCPANQLGSIVEGRDYFCQANAWRAGPWQLISNTCRCPDNTGWDGQSCVPQAQDACWNIPGIQSAVPLGYGQDTNFNCHPIDPDTLRRGGVRSEGLLWSNGSEPYWNSLINRLDAVAPGWRGAPSGLNDIELAVNWLSNRWTVGPCDGRPMQFGRVFVTCMRSREDIVSSKFQQGPFFYITLRLWIA